MFRPLVDGLIHHDPFFLLADFESYLACQDAVGRAYRDIEHWCRMSILNVARVGKFSSDRSIGEYCERIWKAEPVAVDLDES
jgi:starch phosphorylase